MSGKKPSSSSEDETVKKIMSRKVSMNEQNVVGMNFHKYNEVKPSFEIRRKIANYVQEFLENGDISFSKTFFTDILQETSI